MAIPTCEAPGSRCAAPKLTCLCSPTNHPGSFRCSRHRPSPRAGRPPPSSSSSSSGARAAHERQAVAGGGVGVVGGGGRAKGRSVRAHLLQMISSPSGRVDRRRCRDFQPRPSRLRLMNM